MGSWITIGERAEKEIEKIKGSRFIGYLAPVEDTEGALAFIDEIHERHPDARHWCYAYRVGESGEVMRYSDDGEPSGSAGRPMLQHLEGANVTNLVAVVVRYFGGTKLGVGGLARAYSAATRAVLAEAKLVTVVPRVTIQFTIAYHHEPNVRGLIERFEGALVDATWASEVVLTCEIVEGEAPKLEAAVQEATAGRAKIKRLVQEPVEE